MNQSFRPKRLSQFGSIILFMGSVLLGLVVAGASEVASAKAPKNPMHSETSIRKYCYQSLKSMAGLQGKSRSQQAAFCSCVGKDGANELQADSVLSSQDDWRQKAHQKAVISCAKKLDIAISKPGENSSQSTSQVPKKNESSGPDPVRIAAFTTKKCREEVAFMSAMNGKNDAEKDAFCGCVGERRAEYLLEKPEWAKKSHWRQKTYSRAIVTCSNEAKNR